MVITWAFNSKINVFMFVCLSVFVVQWIGRACNCGLSWLSLIIRHSHAVYDEYKCIFLFLSGSFASRSRGTLFCSGNKLSVHFSFVAVPNAMGGHRPCSCIVSYPFLQKPRIKQSKRNIIPKHIYRIVCCFFPFFYIAKVY